MILSKESRSAYLINKFIVLFHYVLNCNLIVWDFFNNDNFLHISHFLIKNKMARIKNGDSFFMFYRPRNPILMVIHPFG